VFNILQ